MTPALIAHFYRGLAWDDAQGAQVWWMKEPDGSVACVGTWTPGMFDFAEYPD